MLLSYLVQDIDYNKDIVGFITHFDNQIEDTSFKKRQRTMLNWAHETPNEEVFENIPLTGFKINTKTKNPSYIPWNLKLNPRATLNYKVDLIIGKK